MTAVAACCTASSQRQLEQTGNRQTILHCINQEAVGNDNNMGKKQEQWRQVGST